MFARRLALLLLEPFVGARHVGVQRPQAVVGNEGEVAVGQAPQLADWLGKRSRILHGRRLRVDTTVVETNIHYPTDATLLADGVRVLTRTLSRLGAQVRTRTRSVSPAASSRSRSAVAPPARRCASRARRE